VISTATAAVHSSAVSVTPLAIREIAAASGNSTSAAWSAMTHDAPCSSGASLRPWMRSAARTAVPPVMIVMAMPAHVERIA
jgi:hypothetical protein